MRKSRKQFELQTPLLGPIAFQELTWTHSSRQGFGNAAAVVHAYIPYKRVGDFIKGQTCEDGSAVGWNVKDRKKGEGKKRPYISSFIEHVWYECAYGPEDHRNDSEHPNSKKRGCIAEFSVKQLQLHPDVAEIAYYHVDHTREDGTPAHGPNDPNSIGRTTAHQPRMSVELKAWIKKKLTEGFTALQIFEEHRQNWTERRKLKLPFTRDDFVQLRDVAYYEQRAKMGIWRRDPNDFSSVKMWFELHPQNVFMWHEKDEVTDLPFILGIQTPWQKEMMIKFGHKGAISMDATHGTNIPNYLLWSLLVFDNWNNGIPVVWVLCSRSTEEDLTMWLEPLRRHIMKDMPTFLPSCFLTDDAVEIRNAVKRAWPEDNVPVYLCAFHVIKNWKNHILHKVPNLGNLRDLVFKALHAYLYMPIEYQEHESTFIARAKNLGKSLFQYLYVENMKVYFDTYYNHQELYLIGHRRHHHSNQDTQSSIEAYHGALKRWMLVDNRDKRGRRIDFLVWRLTTPVVNHYMYMQERKINGFVSNKSIQKIVENGIMRAKDIPLEDIVQPTHEDNIWKVKSQTIQNRWYEIPEPYTKYACCSCEWSVRGNFCKHQLAILKASTNLSWDVIHEYLGTYYGSIRGGLDAMFQQQVPLDPFESFSDADDNDDDNDNIMIDHLRVTEGDVFMNVSHLTEISGPQPSIEGSLTLIQKLVKDATDEATAGGIELLNHMQAMMIKVVADIRRIRVLQASNLSHPHAVFEVVESGDGNSVRRKKDWREQLLGSRKRKRASTSN